MPSDNKKKKVQEELDSIKRLKSINDIINKANAENTLLYTSSRENEYLSDTTVDNLLNKITSDKHENEDIRIVEGLTKESGNERIAKHNVVRIKHAKSGKKKPKATRSVHMKKIKKGSKKSAHFISVKRKAVKAKKSAKPKRKR